MVVNMATQNSARCLMIGVYFQRIHASCELRYPNDLISHLTLLILPLNKSVICFLAMVECKDHNRFRQ